MSIGKTNFETNIIEKVIRYFVPSIFLLAITASLCVGFLFTPLLGVQIGLSILVAICPCMLGLIVPLAVKVAQHKALQHGFTIHKSKALEIAADVNMFVFDLNGSLTKGEPTVDEKLSKFNTDSLKYFYILEKNSNHRIGKTICAFIEAKRSSVITGEDKQSTASDETRIEKKIDGQYYAAGDRSKILQYGVSEDDREAYIKKNKIDKITSGQIIFLAEGSERSKKIIAHIALKDKLRPDAVRLFKELRLRNIACRIFTGSDAATAYPFARELGINEDELQEHVKINCSEEKKDSSKKEYINLLERENSALRIAVVVDQLNDINAIDDGHSKRLSIAVSSAHSHVKSKAQVVLNDSSLTPIFTLLDLSKQFTWHVKTNLVLNFFSNIAAASIPTILLFTIGFALNPAWAAGFIILQLALVLSCVGWFYYQSLATSPHNLATSGELDTNLPTYYDSVSSDLLQEKKAAKVLPQTISTADLQLIEAQDHSHLRLKDS